MVEQPELPPIGSAVKGLTEWPENTLAWWAMWGRSAQAAFFTETDWGELQVAAVLHAAVWNGQLHKADELRMRMSKFGATFDDRLKSRMHFADADLKTAQAEAHRRDAANRELEVAAEYQNLTFTAIEAEVVDDVLGVL